MAPSVSQLVRRLNNPDDLTCAATVAGLLVGLEAVLTALIIQWVPYTEIDWVAYMQEVEGYMQGERDYTKLAGQTGPLVYPAGFVYAYSGLHWLTAGGAVAPAQAMFAVLYLATQAVVMALYVRARVLPPWALVLLCLSKRIHSIFVLRLFNDCLAMWIAYVATYLLLDRRWKAALLAYSAAVSVKMNVLLLAPPVLVVMLKAATLGDILKGALAGIILQLLLGAPFLLSYPWSYVSRAFELSRVFQHVWTVNLKFLPEDVFQSRRLAVALLIGHLSLLLLFASYRWTQREGGLVPLIQSFLRRTVPTTQASRAAPQLTPAHILFIVSSGNFIGIACARTLHFQFYSWYFHTLPMLLWQTGLPTMARLSLWLAIEIVWNVYPSQAWSALLLQAGHAVILAALWFMPTRDALQLKRKV